MDYYKAANEKLEGLLFWKRGLHMIKNYSPSVQRDYDIEQTDKAIRYKLEECDKLDIPFVVQNAVLLYDDVHTDILDVLRDNNIRVVG